ncbi:SpoIIE family protein phosphatase [Streptomyces oceani]|uniref:SpoIIE family protein phosphatase n=1 Tax=Streptomyces oceani TaxID=1075402 RepID=UPI000871D947|nr:SpoIIE family protein phosphatase [Streptomyces oceani]
MRTDDVLAALGAGVWRWNDDSGTITLDESAARLFGISRPPSEHDGTFRLPEEALRERIHVVDYVELADIATLALAEGLLAEAMVRIVTEDGAVLRTVRIRLRAVPADEEPADRTAGHGTPAARRTGGGQPHDLVGVISEVPQQPPSTPHEPSATDAGQSRRSGRAQQPAHAQQPAQAPPARDARPATHPPRTRTAAAPVQTPVTGDWRRSREAFLLDAGRALAEARSTAEVLRVAAALAMPGFTPDGFAVFGTDGARLSVIGHHGQAPGDEGPFVDMPLETDYPAAQVVRTGRAVYLPSPADYRHRFPTTWPLAAGFERQSWAFLPLIVAGRTIGAWLAAFSQPVSFTPDERAVLSTVARMLAQALERAQEHESERELAAGLQQTLRPVSRPDADGLELAARYVPTGGGLQVGGDWYDVIPLPSGRTALVIGDVQGHDVRAAGLMSQLRVALRAYAAEGHRPDAVLARASRFLAELNGAAETRADGPGGTSGASDPSGTSRTSRTSGTSGTSDAESEPRFATCLYLEVDPASGTLDIARAGHPEPATRMPDAPLLVRSTAGGPPLGVDPAADYPGTRLLLEPGETLLLCTDGLIETGGHDADSGWARLAEVCAAQPSATGSGATDSGATDSEATDSEATADGASADVGSGQDLEALADALLHAVHGPASHHRPGPLADRRGDDIALLLLRRASTGPGKCPERHAVRRTVLTVAQAEPERIAESRNQLRSLMHDWANQGQLDTAVLLLSEMLTNVLVHTDNDALLILQVSGPPEGRLLQVEVADGSEELPHRRSPGELASSGRGLMLLDSLAGDWGVEPRGDGKCIWFHLREGPEGIGGAEDPYDMSGLAGAADTEGLESLEGLEGAYDMGRTHSADDTNSAHSAESASDAETRPVDSGGETRDKARDAAPHGG